MRSRHAIAVTMFLAAAVILCLPACRQLLPMSDPAAKPARLPAARPVERETLILCPTCGRELDHGRCVKCAKAWTEEEAAAGRRGALKKALARMERQDALRSQIKARLERQVAQGRGEEATDPDTQALLDQYRRED